MVDVAKQIKELNKQLYPTGRAWGYIHGSEQVDTVVTRFVDGLGNPFVDGFGNAFVSTFGSEASPSKRLINSFLKSYERYYTDVLSLLNQLLADNDKFDITDASNWERVLGLNGTSLTLEQRKANILRRQSHPAGIAERGNYLLMQEQLQASGFDVYLTENRFPDGLGSWEVQRPVFDGQTFELTVNKDVSTRIGVGFFNLETVLTNQNIRLEFELRIKTNVNVVQNEVYGTASFNPVGGGTTITSRSSVSIGLTNEFQNISIPLLPSSPPSTPPDYEVFLYGFGIENSSGNTSADAGSVFEIRNVKLFDDLDNELSISSTEGALDFNFSDNPDFNICANYVDETEDFKYFELGSVSSGSEMGVAEMGVAEMEKIEIPPTDLQLRSTFFIHGVTFPGEADVPLSRKDEFRQLILKLKPCQTVAYLQVNYI